LEKEIDSEDHFLIIRKTNDGGAPFTVCEKKITMAADYWERWASGAGRERDCFLNILLDY